MAGLQNGRLPRGLPCAIRFQYLGVAFGHAFIVEGDAISQGGNDARRGNSHSVNSSILQSCHSAILSLALPEPVQALSSGAVKHSS